MVLVNELSKQKTQSKEALLSLALMLAPLAPHFSEELWLILGNKGSIHLEPWPKYEEKLLADETCTIVVQVNGKVRASIEVNTNSTQKEVEDKGLADSNVSKYTEGKKPKKVIYVPGRILNIVI